MYIAKAVNDTRPGSETENLVIAELVETLNYSTVAPPVAAMWNDAPYVPGGFAPVTTTTTGGTTTDTGTGTGTGTVPSGGFDILTVALIGIGGLVVGLVVAALVFRKR
jgi:hypothetical protein